MPQKEKNMRKKSQSDTPAVLSPRQKKTGLICLAGGVLCLIALCFSSAIEFRRYYNLLLLDGTLMLFLAALAQLTQHKKPFRVLIRLFVYFFVPLTAAVVGVLLMVDSGIMFFREGKGLATFLPGLLGLILLVGMTLTVLAAKHVIHPGKILRFLLGVVTLSTFYVAVTFGTYTLYADLSVRVPVQGQIDYIIVHGCAINGNQITPLLRGRVDRAVALYNQLGGEAKLVLSGGKGGGEQISEAECMREYLLSIDFPEDAILMEDTSGTTEENLRNVQAMLDGDGEKHQYACVTSDYHVYRTCLLARKIGMDVQGVGSKTAFYYRPTALIREYCALMTYAKALNIVALILWCAISFWAHPKTKKDEPSKAKQSA